MEKIDPIVIPNVCFTLEPDNKTFIEQRKQNGFDESETWNLERTVVMFVTPRLRMLADRIIKNKEFPSYYYKCYTDWENDLLFVLNNFEEMVEVAKKGDFTDIWDEENANNYLKAMELFGKILRHLWDQTNAET